MISQGWTKDGGINRSYRRAIALLKYLGGNRVTYGLQAMGKGFKYEPLVDVINVPATSFRDTQQKLHGLKGLDKIIGTEVKGGGTCTVMTTTQFNATDGTFRASQIYPRI